MKKAKIVCTIGPASSKRNVVMEMIQNGMDVARLNFSHGSHDEHLANLFTVRKCAASVNKPVAVLQDLQGIKIRIGKVENGVTDLKSGSEIAVREGNRLSTESCLYIRHYGIVKDIKKGDRILINDGLILLRAEGHVKNEIRARVVEGGRITDRKGVNLPDTAIRLSSFTAKDRNDLDFGIETKVDYVAVSFVRSASDISKVKRHIRSRGAEIPVIAKIEKPEALKSIDSILQASDGIMIARGDLGVEMNPEQVPIIQKELIKKANEAGKVVITATQMLESMTEHPRPTRAEANDVANAVMDGTDALMLSAETTTGRFPVESVQMMNKIIESTEKSTQGRRLWGGRPGIKDYAYAAADAAVRASNDIAAKAVVAFTHSGYTARLVSKFRPSVPIIAFAADESVEKQLSLMWGVTPLFIKPIKQTEEMIRNVELTLLRHKYVQKGDSVVIIASSPLSISGKTNFIKLHKVGD